MVDEASAAAAADRLREEADGGLHGLVNCAGIGVSAPLETLALEDLRRQYEVNVIGQLGLTQRMLPMLRTAGGRIVNIGSIGDRLTLPFAGPLASSKAAFASLNDALRMELRSDGIRVILIEPASIRTEAVDKLEVDGERVAASLPANQAARYASRMRAMTAAAIASERRGSPPSVVAMTILHALTTRRPKTRYLCGRHARAMALLAAAPDIVLDPLRLRLLGLR